MDNASRIIDVDINDILPNRNQPRIILNEEDDLGLTDSVKEYGVLQPIIVRSIGDKYEIIAGERRYRASVLAGRETVPVIIRNMNDKESAEVALIENVQRKELTPIEEALSYKRILDSGYMTQEQLAEKIGKSQPAIANKIRLLNLTDEVQEALLESKISERHARSLLKIKNKQQQREMLDRIIKERLTVRKTDEEIDKLTPYPDGAEGEIKEFEREKGEDKMNNEFINMPQFDSFTGDAQPATIEPQNAFTPVQPVQEPTANVFATPDVAPVSEVTPTVEPQFDIFAAPTPTVEEPVQPAAPATSVPQFDIFANAAPAEEPQNTFITPQPTVTPAVETPAEPIVVPLSAVQEFDNNATLEPTVTPAVETPAEPIVVPLSAVQEFEQTVPVTAPIQDPSAQTAEVRPEPIIITDYNKQYDPVMPQSTVAPAAPVDFKQVIAAIRECADKIESYGYKIDVDEFDLTNIYQAIFKIEKM